jgi:hypothetical protein
MQDIILGGNLYSAKPETGRYDASYGTFLLGRGNGSFEYLPSARTGFFIDGETRDFLETDSPSGSFLLVSKSNSRLQVLKINK